MSEPRAQDDERQTSDEAAEWFARLQAPDATEADWSAFAEWLSASPAHHQAYDRIERLWVELEAFAPEILASLDAPPSRRVASTRRSMWFGAGAALAAGFAALVLVVERPAPAPTQTYATAAGETRSVRLADGSQVRLNAATTLKVAFERGARRVQLVDGEAAFDVTHDPQRPFLIAAGDSQVRVVGTEFDLRHRDGGLSLTVRRGVVEVRGGSAEATPFRVAAGQQLAHRDGVAGAKIASVDADDAFAWTQGQLIYRDAPLSEVAADLTRRFGKPVRLADPRTAELRFTGVLVTDSEDAVLRRLESFAPVKADETQTEVVLHRAD